MSRLALALILVSTPTYGAVSGNYGPAPLVENIQAMLTRTNPSAINPYVHVGGWRTNGDWGQPRLARWIPSGNSATNLGCVFNGPNGQWVFQDCESGEVDVRWFGAVGGFLTNASDSPSLVGTSSTPAVQAATDFLAARGGGVVKFGPGTYWLDAPVNVKPRIKYSGASKPLGFLARRDVGSGETARIAGITYIEGLGVEAVTGYEYGFPLFVLDGPSNYTNMFNESFVNLDGDTLTYYSGANEFSDLVLSVYKWGWGRTNQGPVAGIFIDQVDGVKVQDCVFNNIAGTGLWAQAARGLMVYGCTFMNCLVESVFVTYTSDIRIVNCVMGVGGVVFYRANSNTLLGNEMWNPDYSLINYSGTDQVTNITEWGNVRRYAVERTITSDASNDWFYSSTKFGADVGTMAFFTGTGVPSPFTTNVAYFAVNVSGNTNVIRLATSPKNALDGVYVDISDSSTNGTWHLTGPDAIVHAEGCEEIFLFQNRMDQSFRHGVELNNCNRCGINGNAMWEIGCNMGPNRRNLYLGHDVEFAGVSLRNSGNIQINDNLFTGGYAFGNSFSNYRNPVYGVLATSSSLVESRGNRYSHVNAGVYADSNSVGIQTGDSSGDWNVSRVADSALTNGLNTRLWNGANLTATNVILSDVIPDAFTNLTDFTIVATVGPSTPTFVGGTNQAYMPLLTLGTSTNYASLTAFAEGSFGITQYYNDSATTNWQWMMNIQGAGTNYRRGNLTYFGEDVAYDRPMELAFGRTNNVWWMYINGMYTANPMSIVNGASPPTATNSIHATRLILGYWPVLYRQGWVHSIALFNRGFSYQDLLYERLWSHSTNLVLYWDFRGDQGATVLDKSANGVNGTVYNLAGSKHEFGPDSGYDINRFQYYNTNLVTISGLTGGTSSNFFSGAGVFSYNGVGLTNVNATTLDFYDSSSLLLRVDGSTVTSPDLIDATYISFGNSGSSIYAVPVNSGVVAGTYSNPNITVDVKGRVTSISSGSAGDELTINGASVFDPNLTNGANITFSLAGSDITANLTDTGVGAGSYTYAGGSITVDAKGRVTAASSGLSPYQIVRGYITNGANVTITDTGTNISISATTGGSTNGTPLYVDAAGPLATANLADSSEVNPAASGTNITFSIVASSLATNKIDTTFYNLLMAPDTGTNILVNGSLVSLANLQNDTGSGGINFAVSGSNIKAYATNVAHGLSFTNGLTNSANIVQWAVAPGANISFTTNDGLITIAASTGVTNSGTGVSVDSGALLVYANLINSSEIDPAVSGTNITFSISSNSLETNKLSTNAFIYLLNRANHLNTQPWSTIDSTPTTLGGYGIVNAQLTNTTLTRLGGIGAGTAGDILYRDATGWTNIAKGTDGDVLTLASGYPNWEPPVVGSSGGYIAKSITQVTVSNIATEVSLGAWTIPADTLNSDGDELEFYIPARYLQYTGSDSGYSYYFEIDGAPSGRISSSTGDIVPSLSSSRAMTWTVRVKRMSSTDALIMLSHNVSESGGAGAIISHASYLEYTTGGWDNDVPFVLALTLNSASSNHKVIIYGSTVRKLR